MRWQIIRGIGSICFIQKDAGGVFVRGSQIALDGDFIKRQLMKVVMGLKPFSCAHRAVALYQEPI